MSKIIKKKRVSKKNKIAWRKHVNIDDVEEFLEEKRFEERMVPNLSILPNDDLFEIDTNSHLLSASERKQQRLNRPLKCFSMLEPHTKVPDPITQRNRVKTKEERKSVLIKNKEKENRIKGILKSSELQSIKDKELAKRIKEAAPKKDEFTKDLWGGFDEEFPVETKKWVLTSTKRHNLRGIGKLKKNIIKPLSLRKSLFPSIEIPHPGMSYNPSYKDHQDLLKTIAAKEVAIIKQEKHLERVTSGMFNKIPESKRNENWLIEMSEGMKKSKELTDDDDGSEYKSVNPPTKNSKKTLKQKRKQKEQKQLKLERRAVKLEKKKLTDLHELKLLESKLDSRDKRLTLEKEKRNKLKSWKAKQTKRLGSVKFEEPELEFNMCEDISGNLRAMKQEGSILVDRFKSLQKRNVIEPTIKRINKRAKMKRYVKPGHKDWIKTIAR